MNKDKQSSFGDKLDSIISRLANKSWKKGMDCIDMSDNVDGNEAHKAIISLVKSELVPEPMSLNTGSYDLVYSDYSQAFNDVRQEILDKLG